MGYPTPVGVFPLDATPEGVVDMGGNVYEWYWDWFEEYTAEPVTNPRGPDQAALRVFRGGCWRGVAEDGQSALRTGRSPGSRSDSLGFRVAAVPLVQPSQEPETT